ncbi:hypothetical protein [uncultured Tenacibaculum sp.]|uniref:hypothetical protein n=1 Tax=uncultured Tenacibaculum sp. TaxID=174713 RepID=UPI002624CBEB|nr:hypothetical protein [uncultured Tenacibaculum sp.]
MKYQKLLLLLAVFQFAMLFSQIDNVEKNYTDYFDNEREVPYLHLNKTRFLKGESVWFKAYVLNLNTQKLHDKTSNLYCAIYDDKGEFKEQKLLYVKNGIASGNFKLDSTFTGKNYYVKASTNYMRNFEEDQSFLQKITLVDNAEITSEKVSSKMAYDLQVLPEGGHLLANSLNAVGIIFKDKNGDIPKTIKGEILDSSGILIEEFKLNEFGLAKTIVEVEKGKEYVAKVTLEDGETITSKLPSKELKGVTLNVDNISTNMTKFMVNTNAETINDLTGKKYYLLIHNTNSYLKREFVFKPNKVSYSLYLSQDMFKPGTNIATLFNEEDKPIAERVFFNHKKSLLGSVDVNIDDVSTDSITVTLNNSKNDYNQYYLSASVLPSSTASENTTQNIYSKFLLQPYINGEVKKSDYFFKDVNRKKLQELDLVLLTQGWSKYKWYNIFNLSPRKHYEFEKGITIKGSLNMNNVNNDTDIYLLSNANKLFVSKKVKNNQVEFKNLYITDTTTVNLSYNTKKGKLRSPKGYFRAKSMLDTSPLKVSESRLFTKEENVDIVDTFVLEEFEELNEVEVKGRLIFKNKPFNINGARLLKYKKGLNLEGLQTFEGFIRAQGFRISRPTRLYPGTGDIARDIMFFRGSVVNGYRNNFRSPFALDRTRIYLNNVDITNDFNQLNALVTTGRIIDFDEIYVSKRRNGEIYLFPAISIGKTDDPFNRVKIETAYAVSKEYYQPKYVTTSHEIFEKYGAMFWNPNIELSPASSKIQFKIPRLNQNSIKIFIEGIGTDGSLIYKTKTYTDLNSNLE